MHRLVILTVLAATCALASAAEAGAATVTAEVVQLGTGPHGAAETAATTKLAAGPGERNVITVRPDAGADAYNYPAFVVSDAGGTPLVAGAGCTAQPDGSARCPYAGGDLWTLDADLGDGDDTLTIAPQASGARPSYTLRGGPGDDRIDAGATTGGAQLYGGDGDDVLLGGSGADGFDGGAGHDRIDGGPGPGQDALSYQDRSDPIQATLGAPQPGDEDVLTSVERLSGGKGDDRLTGSDGDDSINGGPGADVIDGRGGDDDLSGGNADIYGVLSGPPAADVVLGGLGNDKVATGSGGRADGGPGDDRVAGAGTATLAGGPGRDLLTLAPFGGTVVADDDGAAADVIACVLGIGLAPSPTAPVAVAVGPTDVSTGCGRAVHRSGTLPGALTFALPSPVDLHWSGAASTRLLVSCADDARRGCAVRITAVDEHAHAIGRGHRTLKAGGRANVIDVPYDRAYARRLMKAKSLPVTYIASMRDTTGRVRTNRYNYCAQAYDASFGTPRPCT